MQNGFKLAFELVPCTINKKDKFEQNVKYRKHAVISIFGNYGLVSTKLF